MVSAEAVGAAMPFTVANFRQQIPRGLVSTLAIEREQLGRPGIYDQQRLRMLRLDALLPVDPQQSFQIIAGHRLQETRFPFQNRCGQGDRRNRMSQVMLAVAERALAVLP